jgi:hypothetical protein
MGFEANNVSAFLCKMRDEGLIEQTGVDYVWHNGANVYRIPTAKTLSRYSSSELLAEIERRIA